MLDASKKRRHYDILKNCTILLDVLEMFLKIKIYIQNGTAYLPSIF